MTKTVNLFDLKCNIPEPASFANVEFDYDAPERDLFISTGQVYKMLPGRSVDEALERLDKALSL